MNEFVPNYTPKLSIPNPESKDQRWFIKYKIWNTDKGEFVWAKDYEINNVPLPNRKAFAAKRIAAIQQLLAQGHVKSKSLKRAEEEYKRIKDQRQTLTIYKAVQLGLEEKQSLNLRQIANYEHRTKIFKNWLVSENYDRLPAELFRLEQIKAFVHYLRTKRKCSPRTINNYLTDLSTLINVCVENEILDVNYFPKARREKAGIGRNWAYTLEQQKEILEYVKAEKPRFYLLIQFMYYTLARPKDLSYLKIGDIGKRYPDQIWFSGEITKEFMERNVFIPDPLKKVIEDSGLMKLPKDWYVFSSKLEPGPKHYPSKKWGERFRSMVLDNLEGYDSRYTLYSWKHTGVVSLIMAGITPAAIQRQAGHRSPYSFQKYLKTLGLFPNDEILNKFPALP